MRAPTTGSGSVPASDAAAVEMNNAAAATNHSTTSNSASQPFSASRSRSTVGFDCGAAMDRTHVFRAWGRILQGRPPSLSIEITTRCPLSCPGCYAYQPEHLAGTPLDRDPAITGPLGADRIRELLDPTHYLGHAGDLVDRAVARHHTTEGPA